MNTIFEKINRIKGRVRQRNVYFFVFSLFIFLDVVFCFDNLQNKTPILGLQFDGKNISFYSQKSLQALIRQEAVFHNRPLLFTYNQKNYTVSPKDIGYSVNPGYTTNTLLLTGRKGTILGKLFIQLEALIGLKNIPISGTISKGALTLKILEIQDDINQKTIPIHPDFTHDIAKTLPAQLGIQLDGEKLATLIISHINYLQDNPTPLSVKEIKPIYHSESELVAIREQAQRLTQTPISIMAAGQVFTLSPSDLKSLLAIIERPDPRDSKKTKLVLRLDDTKLSQKLDGFASRVESLTNTEFDYEDALAVIYGQFYFNNHALATIPTGNIPVNKKVLGASTSTGQKIAYITFDDGPNTIYHPLILDILKQYNVKATFFLIGNNIPLARDVTIRTYAEGHLIGNHTLTHSFLPNFSSAFISNELTRTNNILKSVNGNQPVKFFRPPFGGINTTVIQDAHALGLQVFLWDVDPRDWAEPPTNVLVQRVVDYVHNGSNVLMHSNHLATVRALPIILQTLISEGYTFKTLDQYPIPEEL